MAKTNLQSIEIVIREAIPHPFVEIHYAYTTSDNEDMTKSREIWGLLSGAQQTTITDIITAVRTRITNAEGIV